MYLTRQSIWEPDFDAVQGIPERREGPAFFIAVSGFPVAEFHAVELKK